MTRGSLRPSTASPGTTGRHLLRGGALLALVLGGMSQATTALGIDASIQATSPAEGNAGPNPVTVTVTLDAPALGGETISIESLTTGTATPGDDFTAIAPTPLTFGAGAVSATISLTLSGDTTFEPDESVDLLLSSPTGLTITNPNGVLTIQNDDALPTISIGDVTVTEGNAGTTTAQFTVSLSNPNQSAVTFDRATADGTGEDTSDYVGLAAGQVTINPLLTTATVNVTVNGDQTFEPGETFFVNLTNVSGAQFGDGQAIGTISNDDPTPTISINDVSVGEANTNAAFTVSLSNPSANTVTVDFATGAGGSATSDLDYTAVSPAQTLTFIPGDTTETASVVILADALDETDESFFVNLSNATNAALPGSTQGTGTIVDNDPPPTISIAPNPTNTPEAGPNATFTISLDAPSGLPVSGLYSTGDVSATAGADYTAATNVPFTINPGVMSTTVSIPVTQDLRDENDQTFTVALSGLSNANAGTLVATGTIVDDDATVFTISPGTTSITEGNGGTATATLTIQRDRPSDHTVTVNYATAAGGVRPATAGTDYLTIPPTPRNFSGEVLTSTFDVTVNGDQLDELDETFLASLVTSSSGTIIGSPSSTTITILDDDTTHFTVSAGAQTELDATQSNTANFTITRDRDADRPVTVNWETGADIGGTNPAVPGTDFLTVLPTAATFSPGAANDLNIAVTITGDDLDENTETFRVSLTQVTAGTTAGAPGLGTILDDDQTLFSISAGSQTELDAGQTDAMTFIVTRNRPSDHTVTVNFATTAHTGGTNLAGANVDYVTRPSTALPFTSTDPLSHPIAITITGDDLDESAETFQVDLSATGDTSTAGGPGVGTITDDDVTNFTVNSVSATEGDAGSPPLTFTITRDRQSDHPVSVDYSTGDAAPVSAIAGTDYTAASGSFTFPADATTPDPTRTFDVAIIGDTVDEGDETFRVTLTAGPDTSVGGPGTGTIVDDDTASVSIADVTVNETAGTATFAVSIDRASDRSVSVDWATSNAVPATALAGSDYAAGSGTATFPAGTTANQTFTVAITNDALDEDNGNGLAGGTIADETFLATLSNATAGAILSDPTAVATILDDDNIPSINFNPASITVVEGTNTAVGAPPTPVTFNVTLSAPSGLPITATVNTVDGPVNGGAVATQTTNSFSDYAALVNAPVLIPAGQPGTTVTVNVNPDNLDEGVGGETFTATLSAPGNAVAGTMTATGAITDDDNPPTISVSDATVLEGNAGTVAATFTATLSNPSSVSVSAACTTANDSATAPADYVALTGTNCFLVPLLATSTTFPVTVQGDALDEADFDTAFVNLTVPLNGVLGDAQGQLSIQDDDDLPVASFQAPSPETVFEGNAGSVPRNIVVQLNAPSGRPVTITWQTGEFLEYAPNAVPSVDYVAVAPTSVVFAPGVTTRNLPVNIIGDTNAAEGGNKSVGIEVGVAVNGNVTLLGAAPALRQQLIIFEDDVPNIAPTAFNDAVTVTRNTQATFNVRTNDVDANADPLFVPDNTAPAHGTAFCQSNGNCIYTPSAGYIGPDAFTYTLSDGRATTTGTVNITVVNAKPVANADTLTTGQAAPGTVNVVANDTDPDGGSLSVAGSTNGAQGTVSCAGTSCTYTPTPGYIGTDAFTYTLTDGTDTATGVVNVTVAKGTPLVAAARAGSGSSKIGARNRYTITIRNPNAGPVALTRIIACVPKGFRHAAGSTRGAIAKNPVRGTCTGGRVKLTWSKRVVVKAGGSVTQTFGVIVGGAPGRVKMTAGGTAADRFAITTSPLTATILVKR